MCTFFCKNSKILFRVNNISFLLLSSIIVNYSIVLLSMLFLKENMTWLLSFVHVCTFSSKHLFNQRNYDSGNFFLFTNINPLSLLFKAPWNDFLFQNRFVLFYKFVFAQVQVQTKVNFYFQVSKTSNEPFINKKWVKRKDAFETKRMFIKREDATWIKNESNWKKRFHETTATNCLQKSKSCPGQTLNANKALFSKETFLNGKEIEQLNIFSCKLKFWKKAFIYEYDKFKELKIQYEGE